MPNDNIKRTIDRALGSGNTDDYESVVYEGYGPNLIQDKKAIYFMGVESNEKQNLENFSRNVLEYGLYGRSCAGLQSAALWQKDSPDEALAL